MSAAWVKEKQQKKRYEIRFALIQRYKNEPFSIQFITFDKICIFHNNSRRFWECFDYDESLKLFPKPDLHTFKVMIKVWLFKGRIIHYNFLEKG